ncbi:hypothetical protein KDM41_02865 [bacterium]|nr:hypothetical protein [bacterium]
MGALNTAMTRLFDLVIGPLAGRPAVALAVVSVLTAVWALLLFKAVTPQRTLERVRDRLFGHIYEMGLYPDHLRVVARIQGDLARANLRYLSLTLPALVALTIPMLLTLGQLDARYSHRPLAPGEETVFTVTLADGAAADLADVRLDVPEGVTVTAGPVRDHGAGELAWRLRVDREGDLPLVVRRGDAELVGRTLPVGGGLRPVGESSRSDWLHGLLFPGAPVLPSGGPVADATLLLPTREVAYLGVGLPWLVAFMIFSLVGGLALKDLLRVSL